MKGKKTGGRIKGMPNKRTLEAQEIAERLGVNPFEILLRYASRDWEGLGYKSPTRTKFTADGSAVEEDVISPELASSSAARAAEYLYPKRKAIEQSFSEDTISNITRTILTKKV